MSGCSTLYSTFLQRTYDQIMHDVALDSHHVIFCIDRAGLVGDDGPTHHGMFDLSFLRTIPGAVQMAPRNENELRHMLYTAVESVKWTSFHQISAWCRSGIPLDNDFKKLPIGVPQIISEGKDIAIISIGRFSYNSTRMSMTT